MSLPMQVLALSVFGRDLTNHGIVGCCLLKQFLSMSLFRVVFLSVFLCGVCVCVCARYFCSIHALSLDAFPIFYKLAFWVCFKCIQGLFTCCIVATKARCRSTWRSTRCPPHLIWHKKLLEYFHKSTCRYRCSKNSAATKSPFTVCSRKSLGEKPADVCMYRFYPHLSLSHNQ